MSQAEANHHIASITQQNDTETALQGTGDNTFKNMSEGHATTMWPLSGDLCKHDRAGGMKKAYERPFMPFPFVIKDNFLSFFLLARRKRYLQIKNFIMPSPLISILLLYSTLFLTVRCLLTDENASADLDSSQQQPPAVDYNYYDSPPTNFPASNNPNLDSPTTPTSSTDTTFGINNYDLDSSSSQRELPEQEANDRDDDGFGSRFTTPSSAEPPLLLSSDECDKSQDSGGRHPNARANKKRMRKRQLRNCPSPYLTSPNPPANSIKTLESGHEDSGQVQSGKTGQVPTMAIPGLILQEKPLPNLNLCPEVERPIPVCGREDTKIPMGDSFLIPKCHACKFYIYIFKG